MDENDRVALKEPNRQVAWRSIGVSTTRKANCGVVSHERVSDFF